MAVGKRGKGKRLKAIPSKIKTGSDLPSLYESDIQKTIIEWTKSAPYKGKKVFDYTHHTPNGGTRNLFEAKKFKAMGVKAGYPDLSIDIVTPSYAGLRIELKRDASEKLSGEQVELLALLNEEGYYATSCHSIESAIKTITDYINDRL